MPTGRVDFLPLAGTPVGQPLATYLNGINGQPFQQGDGAGSPTDSAASPSQPMAQSPFSPPSLGQLTQGQIDAAAPEPPPVPSPPAPAAPQKPHAPGFNPYPGGNQGGGAKQPSRGGTTTVTRYDGQTYDPSLIAFLQMLMGLGQGRQQGQRATPVHGRGGSQERSGTPLADAANRWMWTNYLNRGSGYTGDNPTPGNGNFMGGFYRSQGPNDPGRGTGRVYGPNANVGYTGYMRGGSPSQTESPMRSLEIMTGRSSPNSMDAWLSDLFRSTSQPYERGSNWPFGIPEGARGPGRDPGYQDAWREFFGRGSSLSSMDRAFSGEHEGGAGGSSFISFAV